ncbi:MAG: hypothetical protein LBC07_00090 [Elusimicrobiota bacterium]|nr:hypothetical protein [Elusimicrobiota bacterium]
MFIANLTRDLKSVFEVKKIVFSSVLEEQECIYCDILQAVNDIKGEYESAQVKGEIAMIAAFGKLKYGFFHKQIIRGDPKIISKFIFSNAEKRTALDYGDKILQRHSVEFTYFYEGQFDLKKNLAGVAYAEINKGAN